MNASDNMKKYLNLRNLVIAGIILTAAFARLLPHEANITPIIAMAIFGGAYFKNKKFAFAVPLGAMFFSDIFIGFHEIMPAVYLSIAIAVIVSMLLIRKVTPGRIIAGSLISSILFFIITNFAFWMLTPEMYAHNMSGLLLCFESALPFFRNAIIGDLVFSGVFFGGFALMERFIPELKPVSVR